jgi:hypothetical protein
MIFPDADEVIYRQDLWPKIVFVKFFNHQKDDLPTYRTMFKKIKAFRKIASRKFIYKDWFKFYIVIIWQIFLENLPNWFEICSQDYHWITAKKENIFSESNKKKWQLLYKKATTTPFVQIVTKTTI